MNTATQNSAPLKINARLAGDAAAQLHQLVRKTGLSVSEIVRLSLANYAQVIEASQKPKPKSRIAEMAGKYASTGEYSGQLSTRYKELFGDAIAKKYGLSAKVPQKTKASQAHADR
ncbi:MAG: ribbon-helix-helix protein, CopG family [Brachymonas sp.]|nr:ribbon-helix-helix protein, CopG family [Brachymonas sp.]